jgi:hypothetical protein
LLADIDSVSEAGMWNLIKKTEDRVEARKLKSLVETRIKVGTKLLHFLHPLAESSP